MSAQASTNKQARKERSFTLAALTLNLRRLCLIRSIVLLFMATAVIYAYIWLDMREQLFAVIIVIAVQASITALTFYRLSQNTTVTELQFALQLIADVVFVFVLAYFTGGATNPFVSYFLVPLSIAAATLQWRHAVMIALLAVAAYTLLLFFYQPLTLFSHTGHNMTGEMQHSELSLEPGNPHLQHNMMEHQANTDSPPKAILNAHYVGMWFNFLVSAVLIAWFVARMAEAIRTQEKAINLQREQQLYDEQILSIATLAAGTAHELGTPINSLSLLIDEMAADQQASINNSTDSELSAHQQQDLALMQSQIQQCRTSLNKLVRTAQQTQPGEKQAIHIAALVKSCIEHWQPLRPEVTVIDLFASKKINTRILCDESLAQALTNLLNNAANASPEFVTVDIQQQNNTVDIIVCNQGSGIPDYVLQQYSRQPIKQQADQYEEHELNRQSNNGLGFGLFLSNATIRRHGGELRLRNLPEGGAEALIHLPAYL